MNEIHRKATFRFGLGLCLTYALVVWALLSNLSLPFPLGTEEQGRVLAALGQGEAPGEAGWSSELVDRGLARLFPSDPYSSLKYLRLIAGVAALVGIAAWAWRAGGGLFGVWVVLLSLGFLPLRVASTSLAPQAVCVAMLVWGGMLSLGKPWSKTGTAEQFGGGLLLGGACFAAPWGFLYGASVPLHALFSNKYRRQLEQPFWIGFTVGLLPGLAWFLKSESETGAGLGFRPETLKWMKVSQLAELGASGFGAVFLLFVLGGIWSLRKSAPEDRGLALDFAWPVLPSLIFGYADPLRSSLAFPGFVLLAALGVEWVGYLFVNKTERKWLSTFLALGLGYTAFFGSMPALRERQAHSQEVADLAQLLIDQVPPGDTVALFRLNSLVEYLQGLDSAHSWKVLDKSLFPSSPDESDEAFWAERVGEGRALWIDPKRIAEEVDGLGTPYWEELQRVLGPGSFHKKGHAELWRTSGEAKSR